MKLGKDGIKRKVTEEKEDSDLAAIHPTNEAGLCS